MQNRIPKVLDFQFGYKFAEDHSLFRKDLWHKFGANSLSANLVSQIDLSEINLRLNFFESLSRFFNRIEGSSKPLYILYSGGIDSEVLIDTAIRLNLNPIPITVYIKGKNKYDWKLAQRYLNSKNISNAISIEVTEEELQSKWLPDFIQDTECVEYFYLAAYIAARSCPDDGNIVVMGDGPNPILYEQDNLFHVEFEHNYWPLKLRNRRKINLWDPYWDAQVLASFAQFPCIRDRINNPPEFEKWYFNVSWMGKEYFYNDPSYKHLTRRFSQHGWEVQTSDLGYCKELTPSYNVGMVNPYTTGYFEKHNYKHFFNKNMATELLLQFFNGDFNSTKDLVSHLFNQNDFINKFDGHYSVLARNIYNALPGYHKNIECNALETSFEGILLTSSIEKALMS